MLYGKNKSREMARSILPSRWRSAGKDKARVNRAVRRGVRQDLRQAVRDELPDKVDLRRDGQQAIRLIVWRRRSADKLAHFIRWAQAKTAHLPVESRLSRMRGVLPDGLIGDHAVLHLQWDAQFRVPYPHVVSRFAWQWWGDRAVERLWRVAPVWAADPALRRLVDGLVAAHHEPTVWWVPQEDGEALRLVCTDPPPRLGEDHEPWVRALSGAARASWNLWLGRQDPRGPLPLGELTVRGMRFRVEAAERPRLLYTRGGWRPNPGRHEEWLAVAAVVALHFESGVRDPEVLAALAADPAEWRRIRH